ncbi:MAG: hypothetical protein AAFR46_19405 [Pseudomonadota bacterium]
MMAESLAEAIQALRSQASDRAQAKEQLEVIRLHQKALQTVIDLEVGLEKRADTESAGGSGELDLDAARDEIHRRVSGIRAELGV